MKFSQGKIMSIVFLLAIMLIALMFSMYESEGFVEGARGRNKKRGGRANAAQAVNNTQDQRINTLETNVGTLETRVGTLETQGQAQQAAPYSSAQPVAQAVDEEIAQ